MEAILVFRFESTFSNTRSGLIPFLAPDWNLDSRLWFFDVDADDHRRRGRATAFGFLRRDFERRLSLLRRRPIGFGGDDLRLAGRRRGRPSDGTQTRHDIPKVCRGVDQTRFHSTTDGTVRRYGVVAASGAAAKQFGILPGSALSGVIRAHEAKEDAARMIELDRHDEDNQPDGSLGEEWKCVR